MESFNLFCILNLLGGLAFFLYGMHIMSDSLEKIAGGNGSKTDFKNVPNANKNPLKKM